MISEMITDKIRWALDQFGGLVDQRGRTIPWRGTACKTCGGLGRVGGHRYAATGTLTDTQPCPDCTRVRSRTK